MAANDINANIKVGVTNGTKGPIADIGRDFDALGTKIAKPLKSRLEVDTSQAEIATRRVRAAIAEAASRPIRIPFQSNELINAPTRRRRRSAQADEPEVPARPTGIGLDGDFSPSVVARKFNVLSRDDFDQKVRDAQAGIVRGMEQRAKAEQQLAERVRVEAAAREGLGLRSTAGRDVAVRDIPLGDRNGPAVRPRFDAEETAVRARMAELISGFSAAAIAATATAAALRVEAEARRRLVGNGFNASDFAITRGEGSNRDRGDATRAQRAADALARNPLSNRDAGYGSEANYQRRTAEAARQSGAALNAGPRAAGSAGGNRPAAGRGDPLQRLANVLPGLGTAGVVLLGIRAMSELPAVAKEYRQNRANFGSVAGAAQTLADRSGLGEATRGIREGLESFMTPEKKRLENQANAADDLKKELQARRAEKIERDDEKLNPVLAELAGGAAANRRSARTSGIRDESQRRETSLNQDYQDQKDALEGRIVAGRVAKLDPSRREALERSVADARKALDAKYAADRDRFDKDMSIKDIAIARQSRMDRDERLFSAQQAMYEAQGNSIGAAIARINRESDVAMDAAKQKLEDATTNFAPRSAEVRAAEQGVVEAKARAETAKTVLIPEALRQAGIQAGETLVRGYQSNAAAFGDVQSALRASALTIDLQNDARKRELDGLIASNAFNGDRLADLKRQRDALKPLAEREMKLAADQIVAQERQRRSGVFADVNSDRVAEYRRQADRTGNRGLGLQADAYELIQQSQQRENELKQRLADPAVKGGSDEANALQAAIDDLPGQLERSIGDLTRAKVTSEDFGNAALAQAQDAGGLTGLAQNAKENVQATIAKATGDTAAAIKELVAFFKAKGGNQLIPQPLGLKF